MSTKVWAMIKQFADELRSNPSIAIQKITTPLSLNKKEKRTIKDVTPQDIFYLHNELNGLTIEWEGNEVENPDVKGSIKILSAKEILRDWSGVVFFDFTPPNARVRNFHPIDFFIDEACAGAFLNEADRVDSSLYLYNFEGEPDNLHLDMKGYVQMMTAAKGFLYWQNAIIEIIEGKENSASRRFKEWMPRLFPEFEWKQFADLYESLKLS